MPKIRSDEPVPMTFYDVSGEKLWEGMATAQEQFLDHGEAIVRGGGKPTLASEISFSKKLTEEESESFRRVFESIPYNTQPSTMLVSPSLLWQVLGPGGSSQHRYDLVEEVLVRARHAAAVDDWSDRREAEFSRINFIGSKKWAEAARSGKQYLLSRDLVQKARRARSFWLFHNPEPVLDRSEIVW